MRITFVEAMMRKAYAAVLAALVTVAVAALSVWVTEASSMQMAVFSSVWVLLVGICLVPFIPFKNLQGFRVLPLVLGFATVVGFGTFYAWPSSAEEAGVSNGITIDQGIVAPNNSGTINQNNNIINQAPPPKLDWGPKIETQSGPTYKTEYEFEVVASAPVNTVFFQVSGKNVRELDVIPDMPGVHFTGPSGQREGYAFATIQHALGKYTLSVLSDGPAKVEYGYE
jgi:hypothetical protein